MNKTANSKLTGVSKTLRKNMTKEEKRLWYDFLKLQPFTIHRQKVIGNYIVDFYCASAKLVIELDGAQHYEEKAIKKDTDRNRHLSDLGLSVLRYSNKDINENFEGVCSDIHKHLQV